MDQKEMKAIIEGLLFTWGDPLPFSEIGRILDLRESEVEEILREMTQTFDSEGRGLSIQFYGHAAQLTTRARDHDRIAELFSSSGKDKLTNSSLETLAIIAYEEPVTRIEVDNLRGVTSSSSIDTLMKKGLVEECGRLDQPGRPILYRTTMKFLEKFNLSSMEDLPAFDEVKAAIDAQEDKDED